MDVVDSNSVEVPPPGAGIDVGLKVAVTPEGSPLAVSAIALLKPPEIAVVTVEVPLEPCTTLTAVGLAVIEKLGLPPPPNVIFSTGCSSMPFGATPVCPCR